MMSVAQIPAATHTLYKPGELAKMLKISRETLRLWAQRGYIKSIVTEGGHRRYMYDLAQSQTQPQSPSHHANNKPNINDCDTATAANGEQTVAYVSVKNTEEMDTHLNTLKERYPSLSTVVQDVGTDNDDITRPGFVSIVDMITTDKLNTLVVYDKNTIAKNPVVFDLLDKLFKRCGVNIESIN